MPLQWFTMGRMPGLAKVVAIPYNAKISHGRPGHVTTPTGVSQPLLHRVSLGK
jgi:hypothetical protein